MKTIKISGGIELVITDDGGIALKDLFNERSISILPEELDVMITAFEEAKIYRILKKFTDITEKSDVEICKCSAYQLEKYGCVCATRKE